jgi:ABC-type nitrate/sulfonate/bicarbonate transport system permease component
MWGMLNYSAMFAGIIAMGLLGVVLYETLELTEKLLIRWKV